MHSDASSDIDMSEGTTISCRIIIGPKRSVISCFDKIPCFIFLA